MKTTQTKGINAETAIKLVKPFLGSLAKKACSTRPVLKTAQITDKYVTVTDSHILIRVTHNEPETENRLHHYSEHTKHLDFSSYPATDRLFPDKYSAQRHIGINVKEWDSIHDMGVVAASEHRNNVIDLENDRFHVKPVTMTTDKKGNPIPVPPTEQLEFTYKLEAPTGMDVSYNCVYMMQTLRAFAKMKIKEVDLYYYGPTRPMYFVGENIEVILLPVRKY